MKTLSKVTFSQALDGYRLNVEARGLSEHTIADYWNTYRKFAEHLSADLPISEITIEHIEGFLADQEVSKKTKLNYHTNLGALWTWAVKMKLAAENILHVIERPEPEIRDIVPFSEDDIKRILDALTFTHKYSRRGKRMARHKLAAADRNRAIVLLLLDTGLRASELCDLKIFDVDFRNRRINISLGKMSKQRHLPFSARTGEAIWRYLQPRKNDPISAPAFESCNGHPLTRRELGQMLNRAGIRAGVENVHPHRFRHTFAILFLRNGGDAYALQEMLGHTTMEMVRTYLKLAQCDLDRSHRIASPVEHMRL